ncbi:type IV-A pilus assembly ATPase PilB [Vibrio sinaloensis]|uniref:type IV-A pilus assembly ATPase PilB n=1 Tax=Photobacterium sp. (strain ATCC 43367) TaxID=379097 RepID=UPI002062ABE6|nr:type IV-A pilus assembly ATPase PilB [Vibrio sinaloensis]UPQ87621.1 type IV-A pilus assembly ATPase PilB [Vibrio sinaloensis]
MQSDLLTTLTHAKLITPAQQHQLTQAAQQSDQPLLDLLLDSTQISEATLAKHLAQVYSLPVISLSDFDYLAASRQLALNSLLHRFHAAVIALEAQTLRLAVADPCQQELEQAFRFATGMTIELAIADWTSIKQAIQQLPCSSPSSSSHTPIQANQLSDLVTLSADEQRDDDDLSHDNAPVSRYIQQVLLDAVARRASDIHFEPYEQTYRVRLRCDGLLIAAEQPSYQLSRRLAARLKILAKLDIAERRLPQDGRLKLRLNHQVSVDMRVSTLPTLFGEKVVLRILDNRAMELDIDALGFNHTQKQTYLTALSKPQGMILLTGPTGSGKTVSLYAALNHLNAEHVNIATAEDPIEISLPGINQVQVQPEIGLDFSQALRAFLRQDPDIIMVGEVRDINTAKMAFKAAQTGHLVLATLHTNSAAQSIERLINMGIEPFNLASSLSLVIAQRLVRKLCPHCKRSDSAHTHLAMSLDLSDQEPIFSANVQGCQHCNFGYLGRTAIYEVLPVTSVIAEAIARRATAQQLNALALEQGLQNLKQSGSEKLRSGITSLAELQRTLLV